MCCFVGSIPYSTRVETALKWLRMLPEHRPSLITLYFDAVDHMGHVKGPSMSEALLNSIKQVDSSLDLLMKGALGVDDTSVQPPGLSASPFPSAWPYLCLLLYGCFNGPCPAVCSLHCCDESI